MKPPKRTSILGGMVAKDAVQTLDAAHVRRFRDALRGQLLTPTDPEYEEARHVDDHQFRR